MSVQTNSLKSLKRTAFPYRYKIGDRLWSLSECPAIDSRAMKQLALSARATRRHSTSTCGRVSAGALQRRSHRPATLTLARRDRPACAAERNARMRNMQCLAAAVSP